MNGRITTAGRVLPGRLYLDIKKYRLTLLAVAISLILFWLNAISGWAAWERSSPIGLQLWAAHFSHWSGGHLFWDLLTFTALAVMIEATDRRLLGKLLLIVPPAIIAAVWIMEDHDIYRGLSGMDCALYTALVVMAFRKRWIGQIFMTIALGLFVGKISFEIWTGQTLFVSDLPAGVTGVPWAHLSGALAGASVALLSPAHD